MWQSAAWAFSHGPPAKKVTWGSVLKFIIDKLKISGYSYEDKIEGDDTSLDDKNINIAKRIPQRQDLEEHTEQCQASNCAKILQCYIV
jgi:hypothetical protein